MPPGGGKADAEIEYELTLTNAHVVDVVEGKILEDKCVVVGFDGRIVKILDGHNDKQKMLNEAFYVRVSKHTMDCNGGYVLPGLIDCHVHVTAFTADFAQLERTAPSYVTATALQELSDILQRGFTTVRDAGGADHGLAKALKDGLFPGPRLLFCGKALSQTGGHGDMRTPGEFASVAASASFQCQCCTISSGLARLCDGETDVRRAARDEIRKGANHIKVMAGGGVSSPTDRISNSQYSLGELEAVVEEAEAAGLYVMAHAYTPLSIAKAVEAGVRSIEHGNLLDEKSAKFMAESGAFLVPTLATYDALSKEGADHGMDDENMLAKVEEVLGAGKASIGIAKKAGVKIAYGSDLLGEMRKQQLNGLVLMEEAGMSSLEVLQSATIRAAQLLNLEDTIGSVEPGKVADLLVIRQNPIKATMKTIFDGEDYDDNYVALIQNGKIRLEFEEVVDDK